MPELYKKTSNQKKYKTPSVRTTSTRSMLSSFIVRPNGFRFETQEEKEEILLFMRQHPIVLVGGIIATVGLFLLPGLLVSLLFGSGLLPSSIPPGYFFVLPLLWYLGLWGFAFTNFLHWYYNVYVVTNERVVDIDWISLLYKQLSSTQLEKIQDVTYKQGGVLDSFFDFGNVFIQTAGTEPNFEFEAVPKPNEVVEEINRILEERRTGGTP